MRRRNQTLIAVAMAAAFSTPAFAGQACLLEGSITILNQTTEIKDCLQRNDASEKQFRETCQGIADMAAQMGAPPTKITYLAACPAEPQGSCAGLFMSPMTGYYYKRDAESLADTKSSCAAMGGTWRDG